VKSVQSVVTNLQRIKNTIIEQKSFYNLGRRFGKLHSIRILPLPHPCAMLTKHFHATQVCILAFLNFIRGMGVLTLILLVLGYDFMFLRSFQDNESTAADCCAGEIYTDFSTNYGVREYCFHALHRTHQNSIIARQGYYAVCLV